MPSIRKRFAARENCAWPRGSAVAILAALGVLELLILSAGGAYGEGRLLELHLVQSLRRRLWGNTTRSKDWAYPLLWMNDYRPVDYAIQGLTLSEACKISAGNVGNLVWMHGSTNLLHEPSGDNFITSSLADPKIKTYGAKAFYLPVANIFTNQSLCLLGHSEHHQKMIRATISAVKAVDGPTLIVGAGTNAYFMPTHDFHTEYFDLEPGGIQADVTNYRLCGVHLELLKAIRDKGGFVMARGSFTASVLRAHGFERVISSGCPSLFSNPRPDLGYQIQKRLATLRRRLGEGLSPRSVRVAVNLPPYYRPKFVKLLLSILLASPNNRLVLQDTRDMNTLRAAEEELNIKVPDRQITWFTNVDMWEDFMKQFDFTLGARIHGTMTALQSGIPGFLIVPDMRVWELADSMKISFTDVFDPRLARPNITISDIIELTDFDGVAFDRNRCTLYNHYVHVFGEMRIQLNPSIAQVCTSGSSMRIMGM